MSKGLVGKLLDKASGYIEESNIRSDLAKHANDWNWGFYSSSLRELVKFYSERGPTDRYLKTHFQSLILEMSEPNNVGEARNEPELLKQYPPFSKGRLDDDIVWGKIESCAKELNLTEDRLKALFIRTYEEMDLGIKLPYNSEQAWKQILRCKKLYEENNRP